MSLSSEAKLLGAEDLGLVGLQVYEMINGCENPADLQRVGTLIWRHYGSGSLSDGEATFLHSCYDRRRPGARPPAPMAAAPLRAPVGKFFNRRKYQRSPDRAASRGRRRMLGGSSALPPDLRQRYTEGERSVLCVYVSEIKRQGFCDWPIDKIAAIAGVCRTLVQNTLRKARTLCDITVTERRRPGLKNLPNVVQICCRDWLAWLKRGFATSCLIGLKAVKKVCPTEMIDLRKEEACNESGASYQTHSSDRLFPRARSG